MTLKLLLILLITSLASIPAEAQWRGRGGWHRGGGDIGGAVVGGVIGGVIGSVFAPRPQYYPQPYYPPPQPYYQPQQVDPYTYCTQRFRSWNPQTGFYVGYDGQYHRCP